MAIIGATTAVTRQVRLVEEPGLTGYALDNVPGLPTDVVHVLWDGDTYLCVCQPHEIETV